MSQPQFVNLVLSGPGQRWPRKRKKELKGSYVRLLVATAQHLAQERGANPETVRREGRRVGQYVRFSYCHVPRGAK